MAQRFIKLTRQAMRALESGDRIHEHGITYEKLKNGDGRFEIYGQINGKRLHRVIGNDSEGITRTHAEEALEKLRNEARMDRISLPKGRKLHLTFKQAARDYLERLEIEGGKSLAGKKRQLNQLLIPFFGATPLKDITSFQVEQFKFHARKTGLAEATVNRYLAVLSQLFNKAVEWDWIEKVPVKIKKYNETAGRIDYLTHEQVDKLLKVAKADFHPLIYPFILIGLETGMRRMEILSIRIENINPDRQTLYIPKAKAGARTQPLSAYLTDFLKDYLPRYTKPGQVWLFPSKDSEQGHMVAIEKTFRRVIKAAGLDPAKIVRHTLRHTAITHLVQAGVDLMTVKH